MDKTLTIDIFTDYALHLPYVYTNVVPFSGVLKQNKSLASGLLKVLHINLGS